MDNEFFSSAIFSPHHPNLILVGTCISIFLPSSWENLFLQNKTQKFQNPQ